ncbi:MAG: preprotein translocase subunit SecG [Bacteroidetes bacterium]|nr:preprotein translocase subunit SecG [Bacteroidota bacterium]MBU1681136.1 preprotein translocase subunit SecG [Bacteroidota bacterium]MBU2507545.1 preprotein translocase subunit SecG [Bacteroidota bacterium]
MYTLLVTITVIISFFLVVVILLQSSKGGGLAGITGGGEIGSMFGSRRTADFLSKATWWLGSALLGLAIVINLFFLPGQSTVEQRDSIIQGSRQTESVPTTPVLPEQPASENNSDQKPNLEQ